MPQRFQWFRTNTEEKQSKPGSRCSATAPRSSQVFFKIVVKQQSNTNRPLIVFLFNSRIFTLMPMRRIRAIQNNQVLLQPVLSGQLLAFILDFATNPLQTVNSSVGGARADLNYRFIRIELLLFYATGIKTLVSYSYQYLYSMGKIKNGHQSHFSWK